MTKPPPHLALQHERLHIRPSDQDAAQDPIARSNLGLLPASA